jgi:hypothetical protein
MGGPVERRSGGAAFVFFRLGIRAYCATAQELLGFFFILDILATLDKVGELPIEYLAQ